MGVAVLVEVVKVVEVVDVVDVAVDVVVAAAAVRAEPVSETLSALLGRPKPLASRAFDIFSPG